MRTIDHNRSEIRRTRGHIEGLHPREIRRVWLLAKWCVFPQRRVLGDHRESRQRQIDLCGGSPSQKVMGSKPIAGIACALGAGGR